jgi:hypothetical protein
MPEPPRGFDSRARRILSNETDLRFPDMRLAAPPTPWTRPAKFKTGIEMSRTATLDVSLKLPCGAVLPNRVCKAAMTEGLSGLINRTNEHQERLCRTWSEGGADRSGDPPPRHPLQIRRRLRKAQGLN